MKNEYRPFIKTEYSDDHVCLMSACQDGYSLSKTPIKGLDNSEVLARINESQPLISADGSFNSDILGTVFNVGLRKAEGSPLWIVPNSIRHRKYAFMMENESALHRQFAGFVNENDEAILSFANKYGLLKRQQVHDLVFSNQDTGQQFQLGESLLWWREEISDLAACLDLWDLVSTNDYKLKDIILWHRDGITVRLDDRYVQVVGRANMNLLGKWRRGDAIGPALYYLSLEADKRLLNALTPKMIVSQSCEISFSPDNLLSMLWWVFLWEISGKTRLIRCPGCGEYFNAQDPRARFCSTRCRMRSYRKRNAQAFKRKKAIRTGLNG